MMRRTMLLLATMTLTLLVASWVAVAVTKIGGPGPDILRGTNGADNLLGKGGQRRPLCPAWPRQPLWRGGQGLGPRRQQGSPPGRRQEPGWGSRQRRGSGRSRLR